MSESEDHRLGEVHSVGSSVHRSRDDVGVDYQASATRLLALSKS